MSRFFIRRPIFAIVLSLILMLVGGIAVFKLPVEQFPPVSPPVVQIAATFPGASAETMQNTVIQVIEQQMSGIDNLLYMSSISDDTGQSTTTMTFAPGTDPDIAQVQVQNKLQVATSRLPPEVQQTGLRVSKSTNDFLIVAGFVSDDNSMTKFDIANYVASNVQDPISRLPGVGSLTLFGTQFAMRIWLDPVKLTSYGLTPIDVNQAIAAQNVQISGGQLGGTPSVQGQQLSATISEATLLRTPDQFGRILLKVQADGSRVRLSDVARIALGPENYNADVRYKGKSASALGIQLAPGANALATADVVRSRLAELSRFFPHGLRVVYPNDVTPFIKVSIEEVVKTLIEGIVLVFLVMYLFLQNVRATLIPSITVPVVLLGTFGIMSAMGFTINTLSMFGLVLAIGLLVDDAIVVVENVERVMHEDGLGPFEATQKAMGQISSALIGVALVLCAVFVPVAFSSGTVGAIYREFSLTIVASMLLSVFVALTLTPALCAMLLKRPDPEHYEKGGFFGWFNRSFDARRDGYLGGVASIVRNKRVWLALYVAIIGVVIALFLHLPSGFLPNEDQGYMFVQVQTPAGSTQEHTGAVLDEVSSYLLKNEGAMVDATVTINGANSNGRGQNLGRLFLHLRPWDERKGEKLSVAALSARVAAHYANYQGAVITPIEPPPIRSLGSASGFDFQLQDRGNLGHDALAKARDQLLELARKDPDLLQVRYTGLADNPTYKIDIDHEKAAALGVSLTDIDQTFSTAWGSKYINNFFDVDNRIKRVYVQADAQYRMNPDDLKLLYVRNKQGDMVPFSAFATAVWSWGAPAMQRYNGVESAEILGKPAVGKSTGQAMAAMERLAQQLPPGIGYEWSGISLQESQAGAQAPLLYGLSILVVFLSLAALYESWSVPLSVILVVPIGVLGALGAASLFGMQNDVYFQVGLLTTIGLSAKNAILIVEFARELQEHGATSLTAAMQAAKLRLRPIIMTSMAFVLGVLPLALASGAGAASQKALGIGVIGGMMSATFLATFMIPMFYVLVAGKSKKTADTHGAPATPATPAAPAAEGAHQ
ncbi:MULTISPECIES: efflux RND transporter permease subunit [unclassified Janthinobacterium]|uniref:efflux RND transporter permease subunit n=1 Tax=unclassified Janthinobacterium TaxID=2610881 RepID=UPI00160CD6DB|nr:MULTISPECIES: efflux RND transporter permease subunit [unclassified Janthinobacterium]MBB5367011.1 multidrug efflux pump [Janthinobacterium sp. K2C7]MBB5380511.1 multidrug efflux pump [Janthinobacterium sp. K2Li3]MBB5385393.1 multidrug efflux pump [Janthinobacterium sp. K2E3]